MPPPLLENLTTGLSFEVQHSSFLFNFLIANLVCLWENSIELLISAVNHQVNIYTVNDEEEIRHRKMCSPGCSRGVYDNFFYIIF